ncbi:MAG: hypothetical protein ACOVQS_12850 [Chitinophagaceae bacterium]
MKLGRVLGLYLLQYHRVSLPGFGVIIHDDQASVPGQNDEASESFSEGSLSFTPDPKVELEDTLLDFISRETGKMKSLARSDMDSFLQFGHELINISKPFHLEGIGTLQRNAKNQLEFNQSLEQIPQDPFSRSPNVQRTGRKPLQAPSGDTLKKWGIGIVILLLLIAAGMAVRWFVDRPTVEVMSDPEPVLTSAPARAPETPAVSLRPDGAQGSQFGVVLERANRQRALKRFADLKEWGHNVRMVTRDSVTFKLYILINAPLKDTARHRDSLKVFFNRRVWIETNPDEKP